MELPAKWLDLTLAAVDVETTGLDPGEDRIIEVGIITFEKGEIVERYQSLVNPGCSIPADSTRVTGITNDDVADAPPFAEIAQEVHSRLENRGVVAYNLDFDRGFLTTELERVGLAYPEDSPGFDPYIFAWSFYRHLPRRNLGAIAKALDIPLEEAHRAAADAEVAGLVLLKLSERLPTNLEEIQLLQAQWKTQVERERRSWKGHEDDDHPATLVDTSSRSASLGPAFVYGNEPDPLRALYDTVPDRR